MLGDQARDWIAYPPGVESIGRQAAQVYSKLKALDNGFHSTIAFGDGIKIQIALEGYPIN